MEDPRTQALPEAQRRALAIRILGGQMPGNGNFAGDYIDTVLDDIRSHPRDADLLTGIAFKGFPTYEDSAFGFGKPTEADLERAAEFTQMFSPSDRLYDATVWKRWAINGELSELPAILRRSPLILVARDFFSVLAERLDLPHMVLVDIPERKSQLIRREVLARIEAAIEAQLDRDPGRTPVVLFQAGASLGYWLIRRLRLKFPKVIYVDIGQAINIWCLDFAGLDAIWVGVYYQQFSKACGTGPSGLVRTAQA